MKDTSITRDIQVDGKHITIHIHLTEEEIRRLLLPHVVEAFGQELRQRTYTPYTAYGSSTTVYISPLTGLPYAPDLIERRKP